MEQLKCDETEIPFRASVIATDCGPGFGCFCRHGLCSQILQSLELEEPMYVR